MRVVLMLDRCPQAMKGSAAESRYQSLPIWEKEDLLFGMF
jgi:hypothetical protein